MPQGPLRSMSQLKPRLPTAASYVTFGMLKSVASAFAVVGSEPTSVLQVMTLPASTMLALPPMPLPGGSDSVRRTTHESFVQYHALPRS